MSRYFVMTAIPYVNGRPHVGHALELLQVDVLARHRRQRGDEVRAQTGTDDNALKNVQSAEAEGVSPTEYVARVAERFLGLQRPLDLRFDDFIRTSSDPRHRPGVEKLWNACAANDDFYRKSYTGLYCYGCEQFYAEDELVDGLCPEHLVRPDVVEENNWFFRLSRYQQPLIDLISSDRLRIEPASRKREVLSFIESGLEDFSVSRSMKRARGWGIPVPGDPEQVIYVWYDALANYITAPGYGSDDAGFAHWWTEGGERVHVIGKGIIRFHAVYWPAMLLSAGLTLPSTIFVHEYLTADGQKISKSAGNAKDPAEIAERFGTDALRWWMLRDVARAGDTDYTDQRLVTRNNEDLANNIGNLVNRTVSMVNKYRGGAVPPLPEHNDAAADLRAARAGAAARIDEAMAAFDFRRAAEVVTDLGDAGNRYVEAAAPWTLAKAERKEDAAPDALDAVLAELVHTCRLLGELLTPFLPASAAEILAQTGEGGDRVTAPSPIFRRLELAAEE
ncbi:methionine--tRNA ligase [Marinitenerispora sediminis]|uniref:methionine--tRNA ligase n=1 Tax=Marinitenerispora sediminis TaxID=1931232 RepID=A0A368TAX6_9ACTN|nr:methionine--tRNA ligase [Marinitenerispora sediminis]RCV50633.1 methionine--tRNA ligase [Marinitenerispora sediminis]RCV57120.1 methionine--tRNA ligase [Marinitenerispora sediminis]RCV62151.1 methionine--tRNA ligase [Marinitenerispora sediminis]